MKGNKLSSVNFDDDTKLNMTGEELKYCIDLNSDGTIKNIKITNGVYYIETTSDMENLSVNDITEGDYSKFSCGSTAVETDSNNCIISKYNTDTLVNKMLSDNCAYYDNTKSNNVTEDTGINLDEKSSDTNGKGLYLYNKTANDTNPIYYYRGDIDNNFVLLDDNCFQIVRTTDTGGVKLIYNGKATDNKCNAISKEKAAIDAKAFNYQGSLTDALYMYDVSYKTLNKQIDELLTSKIIYANDVKYDTSTKKYTLLNTKTVEAGELGTNYTEISQKYHYTCFNDSTTCETVSYISYFDPYEVNNKKIIMYTNLSNGKNIDSIYTEMLNISSESENIKDSNAKAAIDKWYVDSGFTEINDMFEDTVWCNEVGLYQKNGWDKDGDAQKPLYFKQAKWNYSFNCSKKYGFTVSNDKGNKLLKYPVALLTADEMVFAGAAIWSGNDNYYLYHSSNEEYYFWTMTPFYYTNPGVGIFMNVDSSKGKGNLDTRPSYYGVSGFTIRPSLSLKKGTTVLEGNGTKDNPYKIKLDER